MNNLKLFAACFCLVGFFSCTDIDPFEIDNVDFGDPSIGLPIVNSTFYISDLGVNPNNNTDVIVDAEGRVTLKYSEEANSIRIADWYPEVTNESLAIQNNPQALVLPFHNIDIRKGAFKNSIFKFEIQNPTSEPLNINIRIPQISEAASSLPLSLDYEIAANEQFVTPEIILNDLVLNSIDGSLQLSYTASTPNNANVQVSDFALLIDKLDFSVVEGIFSSVNHKIGEDEIDINFFENWVSGGLNLDPVVKFNVRNSCGIHSELNLNYATVTTIDNQQFNVESNLLNDGLPLNYVALNNVGETIPTFVEFNATNSNLSALFDKKPTAFDYDLELIVNPDQSSEIGFYTDQSEVSVESVVELPLRFRANDLVLQDTFLIDEIGYDQIDSTGELMLDLKNAFPVGLSLNLYFLDEMDNVLFNLVDDNDWVTAAASTSPEKTLEQLDSQQRNVPISEENLNNLSQAHKVMIKVKITTTEDFNDQLVWIYEHHGIDVKLGAVLN